MPLLTGTTTTPGGTTQTAAVNLPSPILGPTAVLPIGASTPGGTVLNTGVVGNVVGAVVGTPAVGATTGAAAPTATASAATPAASGSNGLIRNTVGGVGGTVNGLLTKTTGLLGH